MPVIKDCNIWYGGWDLTSTANEISFDSSFVDVDVTTFGSGGAHERVAGLEDTSVSVMTYLDPSISEPAITSERGGAIDLLTACAFPTSGTVTAGDRTYSVRGMLKSYKEPMKVGDAARIDAEISQAQPEGLLQGMVMLPSTTVSATGNGSVVNLGAQTAPQTVYFGVHVFSLTGDRTVTCKLSSSAVLGFTSPTDRVTLSAITTAGSGFGSSTTATTNAYWRVTYTLGGTTGNVSLAAFAAIA